MRYAAAFPLKVMTQTSTLYEGDALAVRAPGALAPFAVLPRHAPMVSSLDPGKVRVTLGTAEAPSPRLMALSGGVLEVRRDGVTVLADAAEWAEDIDPERAERARERAVQRLRSPEQSIDEDRARAALMRALARLSAARHED